ncbi:MAG: 2-amino-4-hydroxy-6-hydroxymethyldihydropteridine diphosphokinase [Pseudomonadota bacterium]
MDQKLHAYIGLGSNLRQPAAEIKCALKKLADIEQTTVEAHSSLYVSPPMGPPNQPDYVNAVAALSTALSAQQLLGKLQAIETAQGRVRDGTRWGPRIIDLDLLVFGSLCVEQPGLTVPHPGLANRAFVLVPLAEIAPDLKVPKFGEVGELVNALGEFELERLT